MDDPFGSSGSEAPPPYLGAPQPPGISERMQALMSRAEQEIAEQRQLQVLIGEVRQSLPAAPGQLQRHDYEYHRAGTANLFVMLDAHRPWRHVRVTEHRANSDFAEAVRELVDVHYPSATTIRLVLDNLSTHTLTALYQRFPAPEARRLARRLELHYTPKHASWLNMVEIEIGVLRHQCLDRRLGDRGTLATEIAAWERQRNTSGARVKWMFTTEQARAKMGRAYPAPTQLLNESNPQ